MNILGATNFGFGNLTLNPGGLILWAIAALIAGWLAGLIVRGHGFGCLGDIVLGLVGAVLGLFVIGLLPLNLTGTLGFFGTIVVAFLGALILAAIGRLIGGGNRSSQRRYYDWHRYR
jgi:uncharacterized membrane protein YeaQ/YmgE (transglycosylase-associated protein family)